MKNLFKFIGVAAISLATVCLQPAFGNGVLNSFQTTNSIDSGTAGFASWPTNGTSTNAITFTYTNGAVIATNSFYPGLMTGKAVAIFNQEHLVLNVQGFLVNTGAAATLTLDLRTACTGGNSPTVGGVVPYLNTNGLPVNPLQNDFESSPHLVAIPLPASYTNWFNYSTNLVLDVTGSGQFPNADFIGIYGITNTLTATCSLQNPAGVVFLNKKLIPTPLIGQ